MLHIKILGLSRQQASHAVSARELDDKLGLPPGSVLKKSGLKTRYFASSDETASYMGAKAAAKVFEKTGVAPSDIDAIIGACGVPEQAIPCTAALIQKQLGLESSGIACFDVNATCLSFVQALEVGAYLIAGGRFKRVLIVASDMPSRGLNWQDLETCSIFSDGAAACLIEASDGDSRLLATHLETHSEGSEYCCLKAGGTSIPAADIANYRQHGTFHMEGKKVFKLASRLIEQSTQALLDKSRVTMSDIDWVIPHQGSQLAVAHVRKRLKVAAVKYGDVYQQLGNQMAASLPSAMALLIEEGRLRRGQVIYLLGSGAGMAAGGTVLVY